MATYAEQWKPFCIQQRITTELNNAAEIPAPAQLPSYGISTKNLVCGLTSDDDIPF